MVTDATTEIARWAGPHFNAAHQIDAPRTRMTRRATCGCTWKAPIARLTYRAAVRDVMRHVEAVREARHRDRGTGRR